MGGDRHLDINKAISRFLQRFERLSFLPLISDAEMFVLYGEEVVASLAELDIYNREEKICQNCSQRCCLLVNCELYSPDLQSCPVQSFRPALCRMHFCNRFAGLYKNLVKDIGDIFLDGLLAGAKINSRVADLFDSPALVPLAPSLVDSIRPLIEQVLSGSLPESGASDLIRVEIERYGVREKSMLVIPDPYLASALRDPLPTVTISSAAGGSNFSSNV